jgi:hypothetical protein
MQFSGLCVNVHNFSCFWPHQNMNIDIFKSPGDPLLLSAGITGGSERVLQILLKVPALFHYRACHCSFCFFCQN